MNYETLQSFNVLPKCLADFGCVPSLSLYLLCELPIYYLCELNSKLTTPNCRLYVRPPIAALKRSKSRTANIEKADLEFFNNN
ncbi:hypothetical protein Pve01_39940 [Planomonospora venezuelensis]|nr:hypothetical protein Pve01_39940 [Planomonospora venezuelensis]